MYLDTFVSSVIEPGDVFLLYRGGLLQKIINKAQSLMSRDGEARYAHAGFFTSNLGDTFEARVRIGEYHITDYIGCDVLFYKHMCMNNITFFKHYRGIKNKSDGKIYPFYRLAFYMMPFINKWAPFDRGVCSEKVAQLYYLCEFMSYWKGVTPDYLHDMVCDPWANQWVVLYEGSFTEEIYCRLFV